MSSNGNIYLNERFWFFVNSREDFKEDAIKSRLEKFQRLYKPREVKGLIRCGCSNQPLMFPAKDPKGNLTLKIYKDQPGHSSDCNIETDLNGKSSTNRGNKIRPLVYSSLNDLEREYDLEDRVEREENDNSLSVMRAFGQSYNAGFFNPKLNEEDRGYSGCTYGDFYLSLENRLSPDWFPEIEVEVLQRGEIVVFALGDFHVNNFPRRSTSNPNLVFLPVNLMKYHGSWTVSVLLDCSIEDLLQGIRFGKMLSGRYLRPPYIGVGLLLNGLLVQPTLFPVTFTPDGVRLCFVESEGEREHAQHLWKNGKRFYAPLTLDGYDRLADKAWNPFPNGGRPPFRFDFLISHENKRRWELHEVANMRSEHYEQVIMPARRYAIENLNLPIEFYEYRKEGENWNRY